MLIHNVFALNKNSHSPIQNIVENLFNQFIESLNIPMDKFTASSTSFNQHKFGQTSMFNNIKVTFNNRPLSNFDYDDDYVDFDDFERWSNFNEDQNKTPSLEYIYFRF